VFPLETIPGYETEGYATCKNILLQQSLWLVTGDGTGRRTYRAGTVNSVPLLKVAQKRAATIDGLKSSN